MKKNTLLLLAMLINGIMIAQIPFGHYAIFEFTGGSLNNSSVSANFSGTATATTDRFGVVGNAITTSGALTGVNLGAANFNNSTLCFWIKTGPLSTSKRIIQMYGNWGDGIRVDMDGTELYVTAKATASTASVGSYNQTYNLDDNTWHHIAVRTTSVVNNTELKIEVFVDGVLSTMGGNINPSGIYINNFLKNAELKVDPINSYTGSIDDIYMYRDTLSDAEILQVYNGVVASKYYVDINATGNNDGTSWADAYTDLRDAFIYVTDGTEIWVADGKYIRQNTTDRNSVFGWSRDSVKVYGGFAGGETMLSQRDWKANRTIISGDIGTANDISDNCYTVFVGPVGTSANYNIGGLLDGFVIQDGNANQNNNAWGGRGAGFHLQPYVESMEFHNCEFSNNTARSAPAFWAKASNVSTSIKIDACIFTNNKGKFGVGTMISTNGADMTASITNCLYYNNEVKDMGSLGTGLNSVIYIEEQNHSDIDITITNTTIANNQNNSSVTNYEGTIMFFKNNGSTGTGTLRLDNCIIWGNTGDQHLIAKHAGGKDFNSLKAFNIISENPIPFSAGPVQTDNISNSNPMFVDMSSDDYTLLSSSPAIDTGSLFGLSIPMFDLNGNARVNGTAVDLGCYEVTCNMQSFQINENTDILSVPTGFVSYQWSVENTNIVGATSSTYSPTTSGLYTVTVSDGNCTNSLSYLYCSSSFITITENNGVLTAPSGFSLYKWYLEGILITGANNESYQPTQDGEYNCEVTQSIPNTTSVCTQLSNGFSICLSVSVTITIDNASLTATAGYEDYQWFKDGASIAGATNNIYLALESGVYYCEAGENFCNSTSNSITYSKPNAINNLSFESLKVYPNPTNGIVNIAVNENLTFIRLIDITGKTVKTFNPENNQLNVSDVTNGIYFLEVANESKKSVVKLSIKN